MLRRAANRALSSPRSRITASSLGGLIGCRLFFASPTKLDEKKDDEKNTLSQSAIFKITEVKTRSQEFWNKIVDSKDTNESNSNSLWDRIFSSEQNDAKDQGRNKESNMSKQEPSPDSKGILQGLADDFMAIVSGGSNKDRMDGLISKVRETTEQGEIEDTTSLPEILGMLDKYRKDLEKTAEKYVGDIDVSQVSHSRYECCFEPRRKMHLVIKRSHSHRHDIS